MYFAVLLTIKKKCMTTMKTDTGETIRVTNNYSTRESSGMV